ncbi:MAG: prephenate dehydratase [Prevotellaceae bacterium]|jgi:prephenate dehydratase|nr:prephenate dehydratase [Prevotellaceae bacterium]
MLQKKIAIQGVAGAFHELAAQKFFGKNIEAVECDTFRELARKLHAGEVDFAVMAIENTIAGTLLPNYSLINEFDLKVVGEVYLHIEMQLMALPGVRLSQIAYIHSHPIAIAQCREFLDTLPAAVTVVEKNDTAESAQLIIKNMLADTAAIAGNLAAEMYGLQIIAKDIHTCKQNFTRFLALSREQRKSDLNNKASLCLEVEHRSGSLAKVLGIWAKHSINITKIQSVPIIGKPYQYWFYVDLEWDDNAAYRQAMEEASAYTASQSVLGEYMRNSWEAESSEI